MASTVAMRSMLRQCGFMCSLCVQRAPVLAHALHTMPSCTTSNSVSPLALRSAMSSLK